MCRLDANLVDDPLTANASLVRLAIFGITDHPVAHTDNSETARYPLYHEATRSVVSANRRESIALNPGGLRSVG